MKAKARDRRGVAPAETLSLLLERVTGELRMVAVTVEGMQSGLSPLLVAAASDHPDTYRYAQNFDLVWQTLSSLADVLALAAREEASCRHVDIAAIVGGLPLVAVAERLRGIHSVDAGDDLDLF